MVICHRMQRWGCQRVGGEEAVRGWSDGGQAVVRRWSKGGQEVVRRLSRRGEEGGACWSRRPLDPTTRSTLPAGQVAEVVKGWPEGGERAVKER